MGARPLKLIALVLVILAIPGVALGYNKGWLAERPLDAAAGTSQGISAVIQTVTIGADRRPVVVLRLTDDQGAPVPLADVSLSFVIARLVVDPATGLSQYLNYFTRKASGAPFTFRGTTLPPVLPEATQAIADSGGTARELSPGTIEYSFGRALPEGFDASLTHIVGTWIFTADRSRVANDVFEFVPNGSPVTVRRQIVQTQACNRCHDPLEAHGEVRRATELCVACHTPQTTDPETGEPVDFKVMIHKIHRGADLPSVQANDPYLIVGFRQTVFDFSEIEWPQDIRNCQTCHTGPQGDNWMTRPSRAACGSCHDDVNFVTGFNHPGGPQGTDATCAACHPATGAEFGPSVQGAHLLPTRSSQLAGVNFNLVSVSNTAPGQRPTVVFNVRDSAGNVIAPSTMDRIALTMAGTTSEYEEFVTESASGATAVGDGNFSYTFTAPLPGYAAETYAVGIEGYVNRTIQGVAGPIRDAGFNKVLYFSVTDPAPLPRKTVVDRNLCNQCHEDLGNPAGISIHGGIRRATEYCVLCHNPRHTDEEVRPEDQMPPEPVDFKYLIHRIHTGEEQTTPYIVFGFRGTRFDFSKARYPADRRTCNKCHVPGSNLLPFLRDGIKPLVVTQDGQVVRTIQPIAADCTSCHDSPAAIAHAVVMTTVDGVESCAVCHGEGRDLAVSKVHAR